MKCKLRPGLITGVSLLTAFAAANAAEVNSPLQVPDLEAGFCASPYSAGIRAFWWWLNGNVTAEAITRDLEEMKAKGFNGALILTQMVVVNRATVEYPPVRRLLLLRGQNYLFTPAERRKR